MSNKINKQLKKGSPLFDLGQGISNLLDFESIGRASNPNRSGGSDLMGRGLIHLGSIFSQMEDEFEPEVAEEVTEEVGDPQEKQKRDEKNRLEEVIGGTKMEDPTLTMLEGERHKFSTTPEKKQSPKDPSVSQPALTGDFPIEVGITPTETTSGSSLGKWDPNKNQFQGTGSSGGQLGPTSRTRRKAETGKSNNTQGEVANQRSEESSVMDFLKSGYSNFMSVFQRQEDDFGDDNPIKRIALEQPETFEKFKGLMYKRKHKDESPLRRIAHIYNSPFTRTDQTPDMEGVDYRYMQRATIPEYAKQGFGSAAAEGFNLAIDRSNYKKAVEEDYNKEAADVMGELQVDYDAGAGATFNQNRLEILGDLKTKAFNDKALYTKGEISFAEMQSNLEGYKQEVQTFAAAQNALSTLRAEFMENKGTHDIGASKPQMADFYNTLEQNPDSFTTKIINGVPHLVGKTLQNKEVSVPVSKIANGEAGFKLVPKTSTDTFVNAGVKIAQGFTKEHATRYGIGVGNVKKEDIRPQMEDYFFSVIGDDETKLRGLASNAGLNYDAYEALVNQPDGSENYQLLKNDIVKDMMLDFESQYFPKEKTTVVDPNKTGIVPASVTKEGTVDARDRKDTEAYATQVDELGEITAENASNLIGFGGGKITNARVSKDGRLQLKVSNRQYSLSSDPAIRRKQLILIMGGKEQYIK